MIDMYEKNFLFFLKSYFKDHKKVIIYFVLAIIIFSVIIGLYKLPLSAVGYAGLLCLVLAVLFFIYDFHFYQRQNRILLDKFHSISETMDGIPAPRSFSEENWSKLLEISFDSDENNKNKMANIMNEMMDYYTMWVHQIKTPIAAMRLLLQSADNGISNDLKKELSSELFKIEQYVEMVLSYIRLESNTTDYVIKVYNLDDVIKQAVKKYSLPFINQKLSLEYNDTDILVLTDEKWLGFALEQLLSNAVKYTEEGRVTIRRASTDELNEMSEGGEKVLVIEDTGIGISKEDLPRVFEKGYTGYNGRVSKKSTGIGLFLTDKILKRLGHPIMIQSTQGKGTKVLIDLNEQIINYE